MTITNTGIVCCSGDATDKSVVSIDLLNAQRAPPNKRPEKELKRISFTFGGAGDRYRTIIPKISEETNVADCARWTELKEDTSFFCILWYEVFNRTATIPTIIQSSKPNIDINCNTQLNSFRASRVY